MEFNLLLFEGTDSIKFGMASEEIQSILKARPVPFKKSEFDLYDTEDYNGICHVFYEMGENNILICAAVEFFRPSQVFLEGTQLIGEKKDKIENLFNAKFEDCIRETFGSCSKKYDIAFYSDQETVESVYTARKGHSCEQERYYKKLFDEKYQVQQEPEDINLRKRLCPNCMAVTTAKEGAMCPKCNVLMI